MKTLWTHTDYGEEHAKKIAKFLWQFRIYFLVEEHMHQGPNWIPYCIFFETLNSILYPLNCVDRFFRLRGERRGVVGLCERRREFGSPAWARSSARSRAQPILLTPPRRSRGKCSSSPRSRSRRRPAILISPRAGQVGGSVFLFRSRSCYDV
jgi:hypothetical protein